MNPSFKKFLLSLTSAKNCIEQELIQSLWSSYGSILRYKLEDSIFETVIVKYISIGQQTEHPRGWNTDLSHQRKVKSYQIELEWYKNWSTKAMEACRLPHFLGYFSEGSELWIVMDDLDYNYPLRKEQINLNEVKVCLKWLANFHSVFLHCEPHDLWQIGTYWHLATRPDEYRKIANPALKEKAHLIDQKLNQCQYQTIVHGDAKLANFCFSINGENVAAVDFQYVGGGCGMKDVAYFLGSCLSSEACDKNETELLAYYFSELEKAVGQKDVNINFKGLEAEWREMYPFTCADFTRFLLGWMPSHQKINPYNLKLLDYVLDSI
jgi:hypothetical protein